MTKRERRAKVNAQIKTRTDAIEIGGVYFLSSFYDRDGVYVEILEKSHKVNRAGFPSTVTYKVLRRVGDSNERFYAIGKVGTCNATNLYEERALAHPSKRNQAKDATVHFVLPH